MIQLKRSLLAGLTGPTLSVEAVRTSLQTAVTLEHATIPPYLYALYSLDETKNREIAALIQSVVVEEMLHMTLASNVLNAIGGSPNIDHPGFIPTYPGPLPGGVEGGLTVNLAPFSMVQLETFLEIERPKDPAIPDSLPNDGVTIGQFYDAISAALGVLGNGAFVHPPRNQVGPDLMPHSVVVHDVATAQLALTVIKEQGEGTKTSPLESPDGDFGRGFAHFYRFMEIKEGHMLVKMPPSGRYGYAGAAVPFAPNGVYDVPPAILPSLANDNFNYTYTSMMSALHVLFNGQNNRAQFNRAFGLMMSLKGQAKAMMAGIPNPAAPVGPSFRYQPVNPA